MSKHGRVKKLYTDDGGDLRDVKNNLNMIDAKCQTEFLILYLYGFFHQKYLSSTLNLYRFHSSNIKTHNKTLNRILNALHFWEEEYDECNIMARLTMVCNILFDQVRYTFVDELDSLSFIHTFLVSSRFGLIQPTNKQLSTIENIERLINVFLDKNPIPQRLAILESLISINVIQPVFELTDETKNHIMTNVACVGSSCKLIEFFCTRYPQEFGSEPLNKKDLNNIVVHPLAIRGILTHTTKYSGLLTKLSKSYQEVETEEFMIIQLKTKCIEPPTRYIRNKPYSLNPTQFCREFVSTSLIEQICFEYLPSFCYYWNFNLHEVPPALQSDVLQFKQKIIDIANALYQTTDIILPFILVIIENIFLTPYFHAHPVERTCLKQVINTIVKEKTIT